MNFEEPLPSDSTPASEWCGGTFWGQWRNLSSSEDGEEILSHPHLSSLLETFRRMAATYQPIVQDSPRAEGITECTDVPQWHRPWQQSGLTLFELVLESEDLVADLRVEDDDLVTFLSEPSNMVRLAELVVMKEAGENVAPDSVEYIRLVKLPVIAQEVICSGGGGLCRALLQSTEVMRTLLSPLSSNPPLDDRLAMRLGNVFGLFILKFPKETCSALRECGPNLDQDQRCSDFYTSLRADDDPLLFRLLKHIETSSICELLKCFLTQINAPLQTVFPSADKLGFYLMEQLGRDNLERSENAQAVITTLLSSSIMMSDFETIFNSVVSKESYMQILRCFTSGQPDSAQIGADILTHILIKCEDTFASDTFWTSSTPLSPPRLSVAPPSPTLLPTELPLSVVDVGHPLEPPGGGSLTLSADHIWDKSAWASEKRLVDEGWEDTPFAHQEPRPSETTLHNVRSLAYEVCSGPIQDLVKAVLLPQARSVKRYRRCKHWEQGDITPRRRPPRLSTPVVLTDEDDLLSDGPIHSDDDPELTALDPAVDTQLAGDELNLVTAHAVSRIISPIISSIRAKSMPQIAPIEPAPDFRRCASAEHVTLTTWDILAYTAEDEECLPAKESMTIHNSESTTGSGSTIPSVNEALSPQPSGKLSSSAPVIDKTSNLVRVDKIDLPQGSRPRVGQLCLSFVNLISAILHLDCPSDVAAHLGSILVELFFVYKWNTLLHNAIKQSLIFIIETSALEDNSPLDVLLTESQLLCLIVKIAKRNRRIRHETDVNVRRQRRLRHKIGNLPQTLQIAESLMTRATRSPWLQSHLSNVVGWSRIVESEVRLILGMMNEQLGGPLPNDIRNQDESAALYFNTFI